MIFHFITSALCGLMLSIAEAIAVKEEEGQGKLLWRVEEPHLSEFGGIKQKDHHRTLRTGGTNSKCSPSYSGYPMPRCSSVPRSHAHNDYEHPNPLFDALSFGFVSAEADIFLYPNDDGNLRVAHDPVEDPTQLDTIQELYLDPLLDQFIIQNNGGIYSDGSRFHLLVDIKTEGESTYSRLHQVLADYVAANPGFITSYTKTEDNEWESSQGAVDITISGNRPRELMLAQTERYATYDGRASDIGSNVSPHFIQLLSDNWNTFFSEYGWDGEGEIPPQVYDEIVQVVGTVQGEGRLIRFWNLPKDASNVWDPLFDAGVDFINTDRLGPLAGFITDEGCSFAPHGRPTPSCSSVPKSHAHNDYEHPNPLFDALSFGFISAEADIFLYPNDDGNLRVAHDPVEDPTQLDTIQELYLDPLLDQFIFQNNGGIYLDGSRFHLLVDIKTEGESTYSRLHQVLADYVATNPGFITTYTKIGDNEWESSQGAVDITISGNRPRELMLAQTERYATYDGRASDIGSDVSPHFIQLLSDNWNTFFSEYGWDGEGEMPSEVNDGIVQVVGTVQGEGRLIRFWNLPQDDSNVWGPLFDAGVDFINTDRLEPLASFISSK